MWLKPRATERPSELLPGRTRSPRSAAVFIDKDGTLIEDVPYNVDPERLSFTPGALAGLQLLDEAGYELVVVTNQPGLAMGRFSRADLARLQQALFERVRAEAGVELSGFYVCPHLPSAGFTPACLCRKPAPGLLRQAAMARCYDMARSWMIGDILDDVEAGHRAGCRSILLDVGNETVWRLSPLRTPDTQCANLYEAAGIILADATAPAAAGIGFSQPVGQR